MCRKEKVAGASGLMGRRWFLKEKRLGPFVFMAEQPLVRYAPKQDGQDTHTHKHSHTTLSRTSTFARPPSQRSRIHIITSPACLCAVAYLNHPWPGNRCNAS